MELVRGLANLRRYSRRLAGRRCVATIGNFDGLHLGHQTLLSRLQQIATSTDLHTAVIFFEPHPREFLNRAEAPYRLMTWREKVEAIGELGIDTAILLRFDDKVRNMQPEDFARQVCSPDWLAHLVVGDDFRFGANRKGDFLALQKWGKEAGLEVENTDTVCVSGERVSSTRVRRALGESNPGEAARLLGHPWSYAGRVIAGRRRGHQLGFPTANLKLPDNRLAISGVYAVRVRLQGGRECPGVANMGVRPTFSEGNQSLEVHLLDFDGDLYGQRLRLFFLAKLRDEKKFPDAQALRKQIAADVERAREILT